MKLGTTLYALTNEYLSRRYSFEDLLAQTAARGTGPGWRLSVSRASAAFPSSPIEFAARFKELVARHELVPTSLGHQRRSGNTPRSCHVG